MKFSVVKGNDLESGRPKSISISSSTPVELSRHMVNNWTVLRTPISAIVIESTPEEVQKQLENML